MERTAEFAALRLVPDPVRGEAINLGIVVFNDRSADVRLGDIITRARLIYPEFTSEMLQDGMEAITRFGSVPLSAAERHRTLSQFGAFSLGELGVFRFDDAEPGAYDAKIKGLMDLLVRPPRLRAPRPRTPRLVTAVRNVFRRERVLADVGDAVAIGEHKIVPDWPLPGKPTMRADLALKNRIMRVCEIVDLQLQEDAPTPPSLFAGVVTLDVAERAAQAEQRVFAYRAVGPARLVDQALELASLHASDLVNWDNGPERDKFLHEWLVAAKGPEGYLFA